MSVVARGSEPFDLKSATLNGLALVLRTADASLLAQAMSERFGDTPDVFGNEPVVIDLSSLSAEVEVLDFGALLILLRSHRLVPAGVRGGSEPLMRAALTAGLGDVPDESAERRAAAAPRHEPLPEGVVSSGEVDIPAEVEPRAPTDDAGMPTAAVAPTLIVDKPLRSGQQVYAKGGDLVVLATVNVGAEVIADGNIHVYGPLRGKAVAGAKGNVGARIFSTCMEPQLLAIAGTYRTTENPLPADVLGKPAQIRLDGERLVFEPIA